jgi:polyribonucleotide 5'-hydroxyl-kinase
VPFYEPPVEVRLLSGTAEKDGTELALQHTYSFTGIKSKIMSWHGCELEVTGKCEDESVAQYAQPTDTPMTSYLNLHLKLASMRLSGAHGPRVLVTGSPSTGKSSVARCLTAWATRMGGQPLVVNTDPREGMLALPGTLSAAVFATLMDIESSGSSWGSPPTSGPGAVPAKLPLVFYYGHASPEEDVEGYKQAVGKIASVATARLSGDPDVKKTGMIVDTPTFEPVLLWRRPRDTQSFDTDSRP